MGDKDPVIQVQNGIGRDDVALGIVCATDLDPATSPPAFEALLQRLLQKRHLPLSEEEEATRQAVRGVLRNGRYKPTGRGKPASEYLIRAAQREAYAWPRINAPVDVCNYVSLAYVLPISLWDLDRAASSSFLFRLGQADEAYVFNTTGQTIKLEDLIVGCCLKRDHGEGGEPIVNPVKDSMATKTSEETRRVAACIYAPLTAISTDRLTAICDTFATLLRGCGPSVAVAYGVALPGATQAV